MTVEDLLWSLGMQLGQRFFVLALNTLPLFILPQLLQAECVQVKL